MFGGRSLNPEPNIAGGASSSSGASQPAAAVPAKQTSIVGSDFAIVGEKVILVCKSSLLVEGEVYGDINGADVTVGESGVVMGTITANSITMHGTVKGALHGQSVTLHKTARVDGDIVQNSLVVAEGAQFDGRVRPPHDASEVQPVLDATALASTVAPAA